MIPAEQKAKTWNQARRFWSYPNLPPPEFTDTGVMKEGIAAMNMSNKQIIINEKNLEEKVGGHLLRPIEGHEVGHYKLCPYSLRNLVRLVGQANEVLGNINNARLVENLFADLLVNYHLYRKGEKSIAEVYERLSQGKGDSPLWSFYMETFAGMLGKKTKNTTLNEEERKDAKKLSEILKETTYKSSQWPDSIKEFSKAVKKYLDDLKRDEQEPKQGHPKEGTAGMPGPPSVSPGGNNIPAKKEKAPLIDQHQAKDFLPPAGKKGKPSQQAQAVEKELKGLGKELGLDNYKKVLAGLGLGKGKQLLIWFYRDLVRDYILKMPQVFSSSGNSFKQSPRRCELDRILEADLEYSLSQNPSLNPNSLFRWLYAEGRTYTPGKNTPDLLIALDSSGSMPDPSENLSFALLSAMIAKETALAKGNKVAVINFSSRYLFQNFTNSSEKIDPALAHYFQGGTEIPGEKILETVKTHDYPTHILIITDTQITNLNSQLGYLEEAIKAAKSGGTIFLDSVIQQETKQLETRGYEIISTRSFSDLTDLTIKKSKDLYSI